MGKTLTQSSRKGSRKEHADASHLTRKRGIYYYRRLLPDHLGKEVALSLGTRNFREAEHLAEALDAIFGKAVTSVAAPSELRTILRDHLKQELEDDALMRLAARPGRPVYTSADQVNDERDAVDADLEIIEHLLGEAREHLALRDFASVRRTVDTLALDHGVPDDQWNALAHGVLEANVKLLEEVRRRVLGKASTILTDELPSSPAAITPGAPSGPLLSVAMASYCDYGAKEKAWRGQTQAQTKATFGMFQEVAGDRAVGSYTRADLSGFYETLRALPPLYAKDRRWRGMTLSQIVEASVDEPKRLAMKTIKRHFSALGGFFDHAKRHGQYEGDNPAYGFQFPTRGRSNGGRKVWEGEKLAKLFQSPVWTGCHPVFRSQAGSKVIRDDKFWLPLLGLYHGNRLEEFAQLRREDVKEQDGVPYFHIHGADGRQIKNDQSERRVPIHPALLALAFLAYARTIAPEANDPLFPLLRPGGPDKKVGYYFTKWWTNYRRTIGLYEERLDYHSFRHGVTTKLFSAGVPRDVVDELINPIAFPKSS